MIFYEESKVNFSYKEFKSKKKKKMGAGAGGGGASVSDFFYKELKS